MQMAMDDELFLNLPGGMSANVALYPVQHHAPWNYLRPESVLKVFREAGEAGVIPKDITDEVCRRLEEIVEATKNPAYKNKMNNSKWGKFTVLTDSGRWTMANATQIYERLFDIAHTLKTRRDAEQVWNAAREQLGLPLPPPPPPPAAPPAGMNYSPLSGELVSQEQAQINWRSLTGFGGRRRTHRKTHKKTRKGKGKSRKH